MIVLLLHLLLKFRFFRRGGSKADGGSILKLIIKIITAQKTYKPNKLSNRYSRQQFQPKILFDTY